MFIHLAQDSTQLEHELDQALQVNARLDLKVLGCVRRKPELLAFGGFRRHRMQFLLAHTAAESLVCLTLA